MIADWMLERYRLNELSAADRARVEAALATDESLRAQLEALKTDDAAVLAAHPAHRVATQVKVRGSLDSTRDERGSSWTRPAFALMAVTVLGIVGLRALRPTEDEVRFKGDGPSLRLFRLAGEQPERLSDGAKVKPHDVVQVAFELQGATHLAIVSVDGAGHATLHWPADGNTLVAPGFKVLPQAFELDDAPGFERFFLITSDKPIVVTEVMSAAERASRSGPLSLTAPLTVRSVLLDKVTP